VSGETHCSAQQCSSCSGESRFDIKFNIYQYFCSALFELNNERSIVILRTRNTRNYFPTFKHDGFYNVWALAEWFTCFQLWCHFFCLKPNHSRWSIFFEIKWVKSAGSTSSPLCFFPITCTRNWKEKRLCYKSFSTVNLLKTTCYVMHQQFNIQQLYALSTLDLCVLYLSQNIQRHVPLPS
jgi:hypothetical protein